MHRFLVDVERMRVINFVHQVSLENLRLFLRDRNFRIIELDGRGITDARSFYERAREQLPLDPKLAGSEPNWDALLDSLWGGLAHFDDDRVAIVWTDAHEMLDHGLPDLVVATEVFNELASQVSTTENGFPHPMILTVFLVGAGGNFQPL